MNIHYPPHDYCIRGIKLLSQFLVDEVFLHLPRFCGRRTYSAIRRLVCYLLYCDAGAKNPYFCVKDCPYALAEVRWRFGLNSDIIVFAEGYTVWLFQDRVYSYNHGLVRLWRLRKGCCACPDNRTFKNDVRLGEGSLVFLALDRHASYDGVHANPSQISTHTW